MTSPALATEPAVHATVPHPRRALSGYRFSEQPDCPDPVEEHRPSLTG